MSRMSKYLKQTCKWSKMLVDENGNAILDMYGDPTFAAEVIVPCRRERSLKDVLTLTGSVKRSATTYYIDERYDVSMGDLMDGKPIIDFEEYTNEHGKTEGYMVVV